MKSIFLESHHIKNQFFGFGQFNYHLLKAYAELEQFKNYKFTALVDKPSYWEKKIGKNFNFKKYNSLQRHPFFQIKKKYDLWHSLNQNTKIEPYHDLPYLLTVHNITHIRNPTNYKDEKVHQRFQKKLARSQAITYISEYAKASTHKFFNVPEVPEHIIYNGNPIDTYFNLENHAPIHRPKKPFLFSIGEFTDRKNFKSLIYFVKKTKDYHLIIAGKNSTKNATEIKEIIEKENLESRIFLPGKISEIDKQFYYQNCEAFLFPSLREGFGLPVIEAMKFKKPVFISNNTSLPEIGGKYAFYWDNYDAKYMNSVFEEGMKLYEENKKLYQKELLAQANKFTWKRAALDYYQVYDQLLKQ